MAPIRTLIVDDEAPARERLKALLESYADIDVIGEAADGEEALELVTSLKPDLLLLDIQMPGCSGLDVAASLPAERPYVIFCTAYDQYAIEAFEVHALDYLLKPVTRSRLARALQRLRDGAEQALSLDRVVHDAPPARFLAKRGNRYRVIAAHEVICFLSEGGLTQLCCPEGEFWMDPSLNDLELRLEKSGFFRISRQSLIQLDHVKEVIPLIGGHGQVRLSDGRKLDVSRRRMKELIERLEGGSSQ